MKSSSVLRLALVLALSILGWTESARPAAAQALGTTEYRVELRCIQSGAGQSPEAETINLDLFEGHAEPFKVGHPVPVSIVLSASQLPGQAVALSFQVEVPAGVTYLETSPHQQIVNRGSNPRPFEFALGETSYQIALTSLRVSESGTLDPDVPRRRAAIPSATQGTVCHHCHGTGVCPTCFGTGQKPCVSCEGSGHCRRCHGTGECRACHGTGLRNGKTCRICDGAGDCEACEGSGTCRRCLGAGYTACAACQGNGSCIVCGGTGRLK